MQETRIRWAEHTWNPTTGCTKISPGCDHCYAETITVKFGTKSFPNGFTPTYKPGKLTEPARFQRKTGPARVFVNSMSDLFHADFTDEQRDTIFDVMLDVPHEYLVLTKRPQLMAAYFTGPTGYLARRQLDAAPPNLWLGTSIESDRYTFRTKHLTSIPAHVHFLSCEPLLEGLPSLDLTDIEWVIVGGESGPGYRPMDHEWARDLRDRCDAAEVAFYFKQSAAPRTEMGMTLDGVFHEEYPLQHPADRADLGGLPTVGRYVGRHSAATETTPVTVA
jgi:protein gp37